jgi:hypothetical protein
MTKSIRDKVLKELDWWLVPTGMIRQEVIQTDKNRYQILLAVGATLLEIARDGFYSLLLHYSLDKYLN